MPCPTVSILDRTRGFQHLSPARIVAVLITAFLFSSVAYATAVPLAGDTFVSSNRPTTNFGTLSNLYVGNGNTALMQFDFSQFPNGVTYSQITQGDADDLCEPRQQWRLGESRSGELGLGGVG
jgi:hypothetical protein